MSTSTPKGSASKPRLRPPIASLLVAAAACLAPCAAAAQQMPDDRPKFAVKGNQDVVVHGKRLRKGLPEVLNIEPSLARGRARHAARAQVFAKCMRFLDLDLLHKAIDGPPQDSATRFALGRLVQKNLGCYPDLSPVPPREAAELGSCNAANVRGMVDEYGQIKECRAPYDRAAILRRVIKMYAGDLTLTREQTTDPAVQARFDAREVPRNRLRRGDDRTMFQIAVCMVRLQPEAAIELVGANVTAVQYGLEDDIVDGSRDCIGGAHELGIDPAEFRDYVTDAVYRWVIAARGVDSLIPDAE